MARGFYVPYGQGDAHAEALRKGLAALGEKFNAHVCSLCKGTGTYRYYACECCNGHGLAQGDGWKNPAPASLVFQVLTAAERAERNTDAG